MTKQSCGVCGKAVPIKSKFCGSCGSKSVINPDLVFKKPRAQRVITVEQPEEETVGSDKELNKVLVVAVGAVAVIFIFIVALAFAPGEIGEEAQVDGNSIQNNSGTTASSGLSTGNEKACSIYRDAYYAAMDMPFGDPRASYILRNAYYEAMNYADFDLKIAFQVLYDGVPGSSYSVATVVDTCL